MKLRESKNRAVVVGTLKSKKVTKGVTVNKDKYISVELVIKSEIDGKIHENEVKCFATEKSKLYKSYSTIAEEYKTLVDDKEDADRVEVIGSVTFEKYVSKKNPGKVVNARKLKALFVNRINDQDLTDEVGADVEVVITDITDELDKDGIETGRLTVGLRTVAWGNDVLEFRDTFVAEDLAEDFKEYFTVGDTFEATLNINNYSEVNDEPQEETEVKGFGRKLNNSQKVARKFVNNCIIIGGGMPLEVEEDEEGESIGAYTQEEIEHMDKLIELKEKELLGSEGGSKPQKRQERKSGFGNKAPKEDTKKEQVEDNTEVEEDDEIPF